MDKKASSGGILGALLEAGIPGGGTAARAYKAFKPPKGAFTLTTNPPKGALYGSVLPLWHDPKSGKWGPTLEGQLRLLDAAPGTLESLANQAYSGMTFPGDVLAGRASPYDQKRLMNLLQVPMMAMDYGMPFDFGASTLGRGILGNYFSSMAPEDMAQSAGAMWQLLGRPEKKKDTMPPPLPGYLQA